MLDRPPKGCSRAWVVVFGALLALPLVAQPEPAPAPAPPETPATELPAGPAHVRQEAREALGEGVALCGRNELLACRNKLRLAHHLWPTNFQGLFFLAQVEAQLDNPEKAEEYLTLLGKAGYVVPLEAEGLATLRTSPAYIDAATRFGKILDTQLGESSVAFRLPHHDMVPEGIAIDPTTGDAYVGGVHRRHIVRRAADGTVSDFATEGLMAVFGLAIDAERRLLWVTTGGIREMKDFRAQDAGQTALLAYDLGSGDRVAEHRIAKVGKGHRLNDLVITPEGGVYATDNTLGGGVWYLAPPQPASQPKDDRAADPAPPAPTLRQVSAPGMFRSPQGLAQSSDGTLFVADYSYGIARFDPETGHAEYLEEPQGVCLVGIDGLTAHGDSLIAIQNGVRPHRILRLTLDRGHSRVQGVQVLEMGNPLWNEPTLGTVIDGRFLYVANSHWNRFDNEGNLAPIGQLTRPVILSIDL